CAFPTRVAAVADRSRVGGCAPSRSGLRPAPVLRSCASTSRRWHGDEARGRGTPSDRGSRRLVRVPRGDARAGGVALPGDRALGVGAAGAASPDDQGAAGEAEAGGGLIAVASKRRTAASPSARVPA